MLTTSPANGGKEKEVGCITINLFETKRVEPRLHRLGVKVSFVVVPRLR